MSANGADDPMREAVRSALRDLLPDLVAHAGPSTNGQPASDPDRASRRHRDPRGESGLRSEPDVVPLVPAPPVAAVWRPSTWRGPALPGEVIGGGSPGAASAPAARGGTGERPVTPSAGRPPAPAASSRPPAPARPAPARPSDSPAAARPARPDAAGATVETVTIDSDEDLQGFVRSLVTRLESPRDRLAIKAGRLVFALRRSAAPVGGPPGDAAPAVHVPRGAVTERHVREAHAAGARLVLARAAVLTPLARETARTLGVEIERGR